MARNQEFEFDHLPKGVKFYTGREGELENLWRFGEVEVEKNHRKIQEGLRVNSMSVSLFC